MFLETTRQLSLKVCTSHGLWRGKLKHTLLFDCLKKISELQHPKEQKTILENLLGTTTCKNYAPSSSYMNGNMESAFLSIF